MKQNKTCNVIDNGMTLTYHHKYLKKPMKNVEDVFGVIIITKLTDKLNNDNRLKVFQSIQLLKLSILNMLNTRQS